MKDYGALFKSKKITVLGLGLLGRGVGDVEFLAKCGAKVLVTDKKTEEELQPSIERLHPYSNITYHLGGHKEEDFTNCDFVVKGAKTPTDSPYILAAKKARVPVVMSTALFAKYAMDVGATIIGVTGTRGKTTVANMIYHALKTSGRRAHLGGNIRGVSTLAMLPDVGSGDIIVLELDSWQLQGFGDLEISPHISVFTNLMPDHQDYYPDMESYFLDKANIFRFQKRGDNLFVGRGLLKRVQRVRPPVEAIVPEKIPADWTLKVVGEHNRENASLAVATLNAIGLSESEIKSGLESFEPVEGRLQLVRELNGVKIYNDNNATTPEATIAALRALDAGNKNIILIMGGSDKGLEMGSLIDKVKEVCKKVILLAGTGTDRIKQRLPSAKLFDSLKPALEEALANTESGNIVLFSPAFASFGMFKNEYDRNDQFMKLVQTL